MNDPKYELNGKPNHKTEVKQKCMGPRKAKEEEIWNVSKPGSSTSKKLEEGRKVDGKGTFRHLASSKIHLALCQTSGEIRKAS